MRIQENVVHQRSDGRNQHHQTMNTHALACLFVAIVIVRKSYLFFKIWTYIVTEINFQSIKLIRILCRYQYIYNIIQ